MGYTNQDPGCCCNESCTTTICVRSPCGPEDSSGNPTSGATGVTVTVSNSSGFSTQGTTPSGVSSLGCVTLTIPASGKFTVATSGSARYNNTSQVLTLGCSTTTTIILTAASGFICSCFANEPIPAMLTVTGGNGSAPLDPTNFTFTLPASADVLVSDISGTCNGTVEANPCTVGDELTVQFSPGQDPNVCFSIVQSWTRSTDCNQSDSGTITTDDFSFYLNSNQGAGFIEQWLNGPPSDADSVCMGFFSQDDLSTGNSTGTPPFPVPLNITINFPAGGFSSPPITSITITE
jgi:hypothetical protein